MKGKPGFIIGLVLFLNACQPANEKAVEVKTNNDQIFQYSVFAALTNKIYDGDFTVAGVKQNGDLGLGTYNGLNGEMIVLNGTVYQLLADGTIRQPEDSELVPFTVVTFFDKDQQLELAGPSNYHDLKEFIENRLPSPNWGYALKISGTFDSLKCGGATKQEKPFTKVLSDALANRPVFEKANVTGTMVGFWFPEFVGKVNVVGFHLHFISDDEKTAGHVMDFQASNLQIEIDYSNDFRVVLPDTEQYKNADFDLSLGYDNPEPVK
jgi:acetolactate decarboxylase